MRIAFVSPPASTGARIAEHTRRLVPHLREHCELQPIESAAASPGSFDQIVFQVGNEAACAFMPALIRRLGGVVVLHDWSLRDLALAAWPEIGRGGVAATLRAWREGGLAEVRARGRGSGPMSPLNRSVVRFADAFLVHDRDLVDRILADRNAPTPVALLRSCAEDEACWAELAREIVERLESFPHPRSKRKSLLRTVVEAYEPR